MPRITTTTIEEAGHVREAGPAPIFTSPEIVYAFARDILSLPGLEQERFYVALLNTQNRVKGIVMISQGTLDASVVHPREVFAPAIAARASAIILIHNHPSGDPAPSPADREITRQLVEAGNILGIPVRDHIIVGDPRCASMLDLGLIAA